MQARRLQWQASEGGPRPVDPSPAAPTPRFHPPPTPHSPVLAAPPVSSFGISCLHNHPSFFISSTLSFNKGRSGAEPGCLRGDRSHLLSRLPGPPGRVDHPDSVCPHPLPSRPRRPHYMVTDLSNAQITRGGPRRPFPPLTQLWLESVPFSLFRQVTGRARQWEKR